MSYQKYLSGLKGSLIVYREAKNKGVKLSRFENFDSMFKSELAIAEKMKRDVPFLRKKVMFIESIDYRLACFYAKFFSNIMEMFEEGYSFKNIKSTVKEILKYAYNNCICSDKFKSSFEDSNNTFNIMVYGNESEISFSIANKKGFITGMVGLVAEIGSGDEKDDYDKEWLYNYLYNVYKDVLKGLPAKPYIEKKRYVSLSEFVSRDRVVSKSLKNVDKEDKKVVNFIR